MAETFNTAPVAGAAAPESDTQLAALDLGSNSFHLIVAQQHHGRIVVVDRLKEMVRLAAGLDANLTLSRQAMDRGIECLSRFGQRLRHLRSDSVRVVGTNTLRKARNGWEFISRAEQVIGHPIEIISGREEARLIYKGVCYAMGPAADRRLVIDIGGGSTELILGRGYEPELMDSLYMGCVSMSERFFAAGELKASRFAAAELAARQELEPVETLYRRRGWDTVIGTSGTIHAINDVASLRGSPDGLTPAALTDITKALISARDLNHLSVEGLPNERAPVFPGGLAILRGIVEGLGIQRLTVSSGALREGLLQELIGRVRHDDVREHSVADLARRYHVDESHAQKVAETAQALLAQVDVAWNLVGEEHEQLLRWGATLHEIGMDVSHSQYHKHGHYLLQYMDLAGFSQIDKLRLALLVRAHRRKFPKIEFERIDADERTALIRLSVLLRLAVLLRRNRIGEPLPPIALRADANRLEVKIASDWLDAHPLTRLDLEQESEFLEAVPLKLSLAG
jgi:exopolyphosphatase/guanosine-5'-triphosphate,3'-diphosphate pyrophosphatase